MMSIFQSAQERYISKGEEYKLYEKVAVDMEKKELNKGIWAKALTDAEGDKVKQKAIYIKLMVDYYKDLIKAGEEVEAILANKKKKAEQVMEREIKKAEQFKAKETKKKGDIEKDLLIMLMIIFGVVALFLLGGALDGYY
jgi:hypothetical protein